MILLTALIGALFAFLMIYLMCRRVKEKYGMQSDVSRRLKKFKDETAAAQSKKAAPRRVALTLADVPFLDRTFKPLARAVQKKLLSFAPSDISTMLEQKIMLAGKTGVWSVNRCVIIWIASMAASAVFAFLIANNKPELILIQKILFAFIGAVVGGILPFLVLNRLIEKRQRLIRRQMPEFLDLLCVSVQAGLSFEGSVAKITTRMRGPLIEEFKQMQRDGAMGIPRRLSLQQMAKRCDMEEIYLFTASIIQSERLGTSLAKTLATQAANIRERHRQHMKAQALKAPVKIVFPLVLFIVPAIFIVVLLPVLYTTFQNFNM